MSTGSNRDDGIDSADPVERQQPDLDPGLAPDPQHEVEESPPETGGPRDAHG
ncbi:MAG: hypothetical protein JWP31_2266 [Aeromicrobium sp.]|nr:hypothetical protein [Aeromicrobium sp.]